MSGIQPESNTKSLFLAVLSAVSVFIFIFILQIIASRPSLNILISGNKSLALGAFILLGIFLIVETLSKYRPKMQEYLPTARKIGFIGLVYALTHAVVVLFVLTETFSKTWLKEQRFSILCAEISVISLILLFAGFTKFFSTKLGEKKWLYIQIFGYAGILLVLAHTLLLVKPSYYSAGKNLLLSMRQIELTFIAIFIVSLIILKLFLYLINRKLSLQFKIIVHVFLYFTLSAIILGSYIAVSDMERRHTETFHNNRHIIEYVRSELKDRTNVDIYPLTNLLTETSQRETSVFFLNAEKRVVHNSEKKEEDKPYINFTEKNLATDGYAWEIIYTKDGSQHLDTVYSLGGENGYLVVSVDYSKTNLDIAKQIAYSSIIILIVTSMTAAMTLLFTRKNIMDPIERITDASKRIAEGDLDTQIKVNNNDEFATLAEIFNTMAQKLQKQINDLMKLDKLKNEFIAIASHNLRTPLTTLRGYLDALNSGQAGKLSTKQKNTLEKAQNSTTSLVSLTEGLINITSLETEGVKIEKDKVKLNDVINEVLDEIAPLAKDKKITIENNIGKETIETIGDAAKLKQAFLAVLENAVKFNKKDGKITLDKIVDDSRQPVIGRREVIITIKDTGIGIAKEERENVFQKFNRGTSTYTYEYEGVGLGLYLTKLIIQAHRGRIWFESDMGKGTTFYISLTTT